MAERRRDPDDGLAYTFAEFAAKCEGHFSDKEVREYWDKDMPVVRGVIRLEAKTESAIDVSEIRIDPEDNASYTWDVFKKAKLQAFSLQELVDYWFDDMAVAPGNGRGAKAEYSPGVSNGGGINGSASSAAGARRTEAEIDRAETRVDPEDEERYTWETFKKAKEGDFGLEELIAYWFDDMTVDLPEGTQVVVSNMSKETSDQELAQKFGEVSELAFCQIYYDDYEESKGFARLQFTSAAAAERAARQFDGTDLGGHRIAVRQLRVGGRNTRVFVGAIRPDTDKRTIERAFASVGEVAALQLFMDRESGESKGQAKIEFLFPESVAKAVHAFHLKDLDGKRVVCMPWEDKVNPLSGRRFRQGGPSALVARLSPWTTTEGLRLLFESVEGMTVCEIRMVTDRDSMEPRGIAHVELGDEEVVALAVDRLNGTSLDGSSIIVRPFVDGKPPAMPTVMCRNLSPNTTSERLRSHFAAAGCNGAKVLMDRATGTPRGIGFVEFHDEESAHMAAEKYSGSSLDGRAIACAFTSGERPAAGAGFGGEKGTGKAARPSGPAAFLTGLSWGTSEATLQEFLADIGEVVDVHILKDRETGASRGMAVVTFATEAARGAAVAERNGAELDGRRIYVKEHDVREKGSGKGGKSDPWARGEGGGDGLKGKDGKGYINGRATLEEFAVFVGGLDKRTTNESLQRHFAEVGEVTYCRLILDKETGEPRGSAKVAFFAEADRLRAMAELNGSVLDGRRIGVREFGAPPPSPPQHGGGGAAASPNDRLAASGSRARSPAPPAAAEQFSVFVARMDRGTTREDLQRHFADVGEVTYCGIIFDRESGESKGVGKVSFATSEEQGRAIDERNGSMLDGRRIVVREFNPTGKVDTTERGLEGNGDRAGARVEQFPVFVGRLDRSTTRESLLRHFADAGEVLYCGVIVDKETGESRGSGKVSFPSEEVRSRAIREKDGSELDGRRISVREFGVAPGKGKDGRTDGDKGGGKGKGGLEQFAVFVGSLDRSTTREALEEHFADAGEMVHCSILLDRETGESRGVGKVCFATEEAQRRAVEHWHESELHGRRIVVREFSSGGRGGGRGDAVGGAGEPGGGRGRGGPEGLPVFVGGLDRSTTRESLLHHFNRIGEILYCAVITDKETGESKGFGKVSFATEDTRRRAIEELNDSQLDGRRIGVREFTAASPGKGDYSAGGIGGGGVGKGRDWSVERGGGRGREWSVERGRGGGKGAEDFSGFFGSGGGKGRDMSVDRGGGKGRNGAEEFPVFVSGLERSTTRRSLQQHFESVGEVPFCNVFVHPETGEPRGLGKVCLASERARRLAIEELNDSELDGRRISVREFGAAGSAGARSPRGGSLGFGKGGGGGGEPLNGRGKNGADSFHTVLGGVTNGIPKNGAEQFPAVVVGLDTSTTEESLRRHADQAGEVVRCSILVDEETGKSRGVGRIYFASEEARQQAIRNLTGSELDGRQISVRRFGASLPHTSSGLPCGGATGGGVNGEASMPDWSRTWACSPGKDGGGGKGDSLAASRFPVFVGGLSRSTTREALLQHFSAAGEVAYCNVAVGGEQDATGAKGIGKVSFTTEVARRRALDEWNGSELDGRQILVREFGGGGKGEALGSGKGQPGSAASFPLFVGGLAKATTRDSLASHFLSVGELSFCNVMTDRDTGESKGVGKVVFTTEEAQQRALAELSGSELDGRRILVREFGSPARPAVGVQG